MLGTNHFKKIINCKKKKNNYLFLSKQCNEKFHSLMTFSDSFRGWHIAAHKIYTGQFSYDVVTVLVVNSFLEQYFMTLIRNKTNSLESYFFRIKIVRVWCSYWCNIVSEIISKYCFTIFR